MDNASLCPCSILLFPKIHHNNRGRNLGVFRDFIWSCCCLPSILYSQFFPFPSVLGYRAPSNENHTLFPVRIPTEFASQCSFGISKLEMQVHPLLLNPAGLRQIPGAVSISIRISHPSKHGRNFSSRFMGKRERELPHHPRIPPELRILEAGIRLEQGQG